MRSVPINSFLSFPLLKTAISLWSLTLVAQLAVSQDMNLRCLSRSGSVPLSSVPNASAQGFILGLWIPPCPKASSLWQALRAALIPEAGTSKGAATCRRSLRCARGEVCDLGSHSSAGSFSWACSLSKACPCARSLSAAGLAYRHREEDYEFPVVGANLSWRV